MRFMVIVKATKSSEAGALPSEELLAEMGKFNEDLIKAGVLLAGEGLQASSKGVRVKFAGEKRTVIDGPFTEFIGTVSDINIDRNKVTVLVSFFGRETPVVLDFLQVEKI